MSSNTQRSKAERLRALHHGPHILVLPNAWDVPSARVFEDAGFPAVGTTSAGIAAVFGYPDGQRLSRDQMLDAVARIASAVEIPVTADMEAGYGNTLEVMADTAQAVITSGAVGLNIEDSNGQGELPLTEASFQAEKVKAIRESADKAGVPLVLNARTDVYLLAVGDDEESRFSEAVCRANLYLEAGADCAFIPGVKDAAVITRLVKEVKGSISLLALSGVPPAAELERLRVARVSVGSGPQRATMSLVRRIAEELLGQGTYTSFTENTISHAEVNRFFENPGPLQS